jgi:hypothetical protein
MFCIFMIVNKLAETPWGDSFQTDPLFRQDLCVGQEMNRAFYIIFTPVLLVMVGYILVFRAMGLAPGYPRLVVAFLLLAGVILWVSRKVSGKAASGPR